MIPPVFWHILGTEREQGFGLFYDSTSFLVPSLGQRESRVLDYFRVSGDKIYFCVVEVVFISSWAQSKERRVSVRNLKELFLTLLQNVPSHSFSSGSGLRCSPGMSFIFHIISSALL